MNNTLTLSNANIVDVANGAILSNRSLVLRDENITFIADASSAPGENADVATDVAGRYLCPGLIDAHVHFFLDGGPDPRGRYLESDDEALLACARDNARLALEAGITTMRDCGAPAPLMFDFQRRVKGGEIPGPHIVSCGYPLMRPKGHCHFMGGEVSGADDVRRLVEWHLEQGAAFVKLMASGGGLTPGTVPHEADLPLELMQLAADLAQRHGVPITAHCHATESIERAIEAGLGMVEHASFVEAPGRYRYDERLAERLRDRGIVVCPTVVSALRTARRFQESGAAHNPGDVAAVERLLGRATNAGHFHRRGLDLIAGTDCGATYTPFDSLVDELLSYAEAGMPTAEVLRVTTRDNARHLRLDRVGEIKEGYRADLILLDANPLEDLEALRRPRQVFKSGQCVYQKRQ